MARAKRLRSCASLLLIVAAATVADAAEALRLLAPDEPVAGRSQAQWSRDWWQWAASFDDEDSPVADTTGERCHLRQAGPVWFLAGTYGTRRTIRQCTVPAGKYLFFPLINYVVFPRTGIAGRLRCDEAIDSARELTDDVDSLVLDLDGRRGTGLPRHRFASPGCFDLWARSPGGGRLYPAASNGYYAMLTPLKPGRYELNFGGSLPGMSQAVTYTLIVK